MRSIKELSQNFTRPQTIGLLICMIVFGAIGTYAVLSSHADTVNCTYHATTSNFSSTFSSASGGSTICLAPGNYGNWTGGTKTSMVTIIPDPTTGGTAPTPPTPKPGGTDTAHNINTNGTGTDGNVVFNGLNFGNAAFITMNGITFSDDVNMPGDPTMSPHDITIRNSIFHAHLFMYDTKLNNANIIIDYNMFPGDKADCLNGWEGRIQIGSATGHSATPDGVVIENNNIGGVPSVQCDGIQSGATGLQVLNNWFHDFHYANAAHTDGMQGYGSTGDVVKGNFFYDVPDGYVAYDGMSNDDIENNVFVNDCSNSCNGASPNQVDLLANTGNTLFNHNTVVGGRSYSSSGGEGNILIGTKGAKCSGLTITNNVATSISNGDGSGNCTYTASYNLLINGGGNGTGNITGSPAYVGGDCGNLDADPPGACGDVWANFMLKPGDSITSPGYNAASDGTSMGAYGPGPSTPGGPYGASTSGGGTTTPPPPAPTVTLTAAPTSINAGATSKLTWSSTNTTACSASWTTSTATSGSVTLTPTATTTYTITCNGAGGSANASATVTVAATQPVPTVTLTAAPTSITSGATSKLTWASTNATTCVGSWSTAAIATSGSATLTPTATTTYTITCNGAGGSATASASVTVKVPDSAPPTTAITAPASNANVTGTVNITANATDNVGVTKVEIYVDNSMLASLTGSPYATTWNAQAVSNGTHTIYSKAYDAAGNVGTSSTITVTVNNTDTTAPTAPSNVKATAASPTQVNLSWAASTDNVGVDHYIIERNNVTVATVKAPSVTYTDNTVAGSTSYTYNVVAVDQAGNASSLSGNASVTTPAPQDTSAPTAPSNVKATAASPTQVNLSWAASTDSGSGVAGYQVFRNGTKLSQVSAQTTSYGDATAAPNTTYSYYIIAIDAANNASQQSNTATITTPQATTNTLLVGSTRGGNSKDSNSNGQAEAFQLSSVGSGSLTSLTFFNDSSSNATQVSMGIYSDNHGKPGQLLTQGSIVTPARNTWVKVPVGNVVIRKGTPYWVAILGLGKGKVIFHDNDNGSVDYVSKSSSLKTLPAAWQSGTKYNDSPLSVYGTN